MKKMIDMIRNNPICRMVNETKEISEKLLNVLSNGGGEKIFAKQKAHPYDKFKHVEGRRHVNPR